MDEATSAVAKRLQDVIALIDEVGVPEDLRGVAFAKIWDAGSAPQPAIPSSPAASTTTTGTRDALGLIASRLGIDRDSAEQVYAVDGDDLELVLPASRLKPAKSQATADIALLVAAGRQAAGIDADGWTRVDPIRVQSENYKKYDQANFATTIKALDTVVTIRGNGRDRKIKMTNPAYARASELVRALVGASE
jgi:hypothetical protein